jgi:Neocarzinostatin family
MNTYVGAHMRRIALALTALLIGSLAPIVAGTAANAAPPPTVTVEPSTNLFDGQIVHVSGLFMPQSTVVAVECKNRPDTLNFCDQSTAAFTQTDIRGAYATDMPVRRTLRTSHGTVDCARHADTCVMIVFAFSDPAGGFGQAAISFAPPGPPARGVITAPMSVPADRTASISLSDFAPYAAIGTNLCAADPANARDCIEPHTVYVDDTGATALALQASETIRTQSKRTIDCTDTGACVYAAWDVRDFAGTLATTPVVIAPKAPGTFGVEPNAGLHDGDSVTAAGSDWPALKTIHLATCDGLSATATCVHGAIAKIRPDGFFSKDYKVHAVSDDGSVNCLTGPCWIIAVRYLQGIPVFAAVGITFSG